MPSAAACPIRASIPRILRPIFFPSGRSPTLSVLSFFEISVSRSRHEPVPWGKSPKVRRLHCPLSRPQNFRIPSSLVSRSAFRWRRCEIKNAKNEIFLDEGAEQRKAPRVQQINNPRAPVSTREREKWSCLSGSETWL